MENTRRSFIKKSVAATAGLTIAGLGVSAKSYQNILGANDRINIAFAGVNGRGRGLINSASEVANVHAAYICDVDSNVLKDRTAKAEESFGHKPKMEEDFRKILEDKDVDAVAIATPDHWHAPMAIMAAQAGKDVYVEKPCSHNPYEGELLVKVQEKTGRIIQMGNQQRSAGSSIIAIKDIHKGIIGEPYFGKAWYSGRRSGIGHGQKAQVPEWLNWELWQGPAPRRDYQGIWVHYNWHWFWHYGTGEVNNNGLHELDICRWAMQAGHPEKVSSSGGRFHFDDDWEFYDTQVVNYEYPGNKLITWEGKSCNSFVHHDRGRGATIHGTKGTVLLDRDGYIAYDLNGDIIKEVKEEGENVSMGIVGGGSMTTNHIKNFVNAIRKGEKLHSPIHEGVISAHMCHLGNISQHLGRTLHLDTITGKVVGDGQAMQMWKREYESGWEPKV
ncbi:MAG: Gfo/Idh/MocA family protein [Bacteroidota bacterium]